MPFCCLGNTNEIEVVIANGTAENVFCRLTSDRTFVKKQAGAGNFTVSGVAGIGANIDVEYEHKVGGGDGYTSVSPRSRMPMETTGKPAYLTIISETGNKVCLDYSVNKGRNFIVSKAFHLKCSSETDQWTDIDGIFYGFNDQPKPNVVRVDSKSSSTGSLGSISILESVQSVEDVDHLKSHKDRNVDAIADYFNGTQRSGVQREKKKEIRVANGSNEIIYCRVVNYQDVSKGNNKVGQTPIAPNSHLRFTATDVYHAMTIMSRSNVQICLNHVVMEGNGYIVSEGNFLQKSMEGEIWKDTDGIDHKNAAQNTIIKNDDGSLNPANLFADTLTSDTEAKKRVEIEEELDERF